MSAAYDYLIFDLDGTISDPKQGIVNCFNYSLRAHGLEEKPADEIARFIGPPLDQSFSNITGITEHDAVVSFVEKYRERYADVGYAENLLYDGVKATLEQLAGHYKLAICTSKRADFAIKILAMFDLLTLFEFVNGGDVGIEKWQQLAKLSEQQKINQRSLMIGDRAVDLTAAHKNNLDSAGVLWGYGSRQELEQEQPKFIFERVDQLSKGLVDG